MVVAWLAMAFAVLAGFLLVRALVMDWREKRQWRRDSEAIRRRWL